MFYRFVPMKKITAKERLSKRMSDAYDKLQKIAANKTPEGETTLTFVEVGRNLGITSQTVYNYTQRKGGNGYLIDALIEEFENLPTNDK